MQPAKHWSALRRPGDCLRRSLLIPRSLAFTHGMAQDYYEILQVHPRADQEAIEAAYARLRQLYDPARLEGAADELVELARRKRDAIERAYAVLADPQRRAAYDAEHAALGRAPGPDQAGQRSADGAGVDVRPDPGRHPPAVELLDYRPLPPARRTERPRGFDAQPVIAARGRQLAGTEARLRTLLVGLAGLFVLVIAISLAVTGGGGPPPAAPVPTPGPFDQFEPLIPQARQLAEQTASDPQAWINYGNLLYNSAEIVRENAPDSLLYQQRLPRWLEATVAYSRALTLEPNNPATRADLGASACFYGAGTGDTRFVRMGIAEARRAAQEAPDNPRVLLSLGHCLVSAQPRQVQEAIANWQRVVQLAPPDSPLAAQARQLIAQYSQ